MLATGASYAVVMGLVGALSVVVMLVAGVAENIEMAIGGALGGAGYAAIITLLARRQLLRGAMAYAIMLPFAAVPTAFFVAAELLLPAGAASYITGPFSYLSMLIVVINGFFLNFWLSVASGGVAAIGYLLMSVLATQGMQQHLSSTDPTLLQDLVSLPIYAIKSFMIAFTGVAVGGLNVLGTAAAVAGRDGDTSAPKRRGAVRSVRQRRSTRQAIGSGQPQPRRTQRDGRAVQRSARLYDADRDDGTG